MKIGTLSCRLFGHKLIGTSQWLEDGPSGLKTIVKTQLTPVDYCIRCGIKREEILNPLIGT